MGLAGVKLANKPKNKTIQYSKNFELRIKVEHDFKEKN
jgi:hypothetical protein